MAKKETIPVISESDPTVVAYVNADEAVPAGYDLPTTRLVTDPQSPAAVLSWLTMAQLVEIAADAGVLNPSSITDKDLLVSEIMVARGLVEYDAGTPLGSTSGQATLDSGSITVNTSAVTATCQILITPADAPSGWLYISGRSNGVSFEISSTELTDDCRVDWLIVEP